MGGPVLGLGALATNPCNHPGKQAPGEESTGPVLKGLSGAYIRRYALAVATRMITLRLRPEDEALTEVLKESVGIESTTELFRMALRSLAKEQAAVAPAVKPRKKATKA